MSRYPKQRRPSPSDGGDFARGERTLPAAPAGPDFARGERELPQPDVVPDYARGERELPPDGDGPDFARGQREESNTGAPLLAPTKCVTAEHLGREHARTLQQLFQHPLSHNIEWRQVRSLLEAVGSVTEDHNGHLRVTINGESFTAHRPQHKDMADVQILINLRHFLERVGVTPQSPHHKGEPGDDSSTHAGGD